MQNSTPTISPAMVPQTPIAAPVEVELGLRSESGALAASSPQQTIEVEYAEPTGADLFVNGHVGEQPIVVRVDRAASIATGDRVGIAWRLVDASVFDRQSGNRL